MASYALGQHLVGQGLLDAFSFFHEPDRNGGFVSYQNQTAALDMGLVSISSNNHVKLGVDSSNVYQTTDTGRPSVKLTSKQGWTHGLFIADFDHMPASACGTWPAFWALNNANDAKNWPEGGELDIIEGQNDAQRNLFAAHTTAGCSQPASGFAATSTRMDCGPDENNLGCPYVATDDSSYGDTFNVAGGGVYAMQWESDGIKIWHWKRADIPQNIRLAPLLTPDPESWGMPQATFGGASCDTDTYFYNMSLAININFCGDYAGNLWSSSETCARKAPTCREYVAANPQAFTQSYWEINYIEYWSRPSNASNFNSTGPSNSTGTNNTMSTTTTPLFPLNSTAPAATHVVTIATADPSMMPTAVSSGLAANPGSIDGWTLLGCFGSADGYAGFEAVADLPDMDNDVCVAACAAAGRRYASTYRMTCYCAAALGDAQATASARCDVPCPGSGLETCGGLVAGAGAGAGAGNLTLAGGNSTFLNSTLFNATVVGDNSSTTSLIARMHRNRRTAPSDVLLTLYGDLSRDAAPPAAPGMGGGVPNATAAAVVTVIAPVTVTYTTVCATNPTQLVAVAYRTTLTVEQCANGSSTRNPTDMVPMTTLTEACAACGPRGESTVTLTVPVAAMATGERPAGVVVTALAYATVVPVNGSFAHSNTTSPTGGVPVRMPAMAGAQVMSASGVIAWGVAIWAGVFGAILIL